jgi:hypothetical protein
MKREIVVPILLLAVATASAQPGKWASADDPTAKMMIDAERKWAESACDHNRIAEQIVADDYQGTSTDGQRVTKAQELAEASGPAAAKDCRLIDAKVRFFGDNVALIYGSESRILKSKDGKEARRCQIWTDTWLKRNGKWQIVASQDAVTPCK